MAKKKRNSTANNMVTQGATSSQTNTCKNISGSSAETVINGPVVAATNLSNVQPVPPDGQQATLVSQDGQLVELEDQLNREQVRQLQHAARMQVISYGQQVNSVTGALGSISSMGGLATYLNVDLRDYEESARSLDMDLREDPQDVGRFTEALGTLKYYCNAYVDRILVHLKVGESIAKFHRALTHMKLEINIMLALKGLNIYSSEAVDIYNVILIESDKINKKVRQLAKPLVMRHSNFSGRWTANKAQKSKDDSSNQDDRISILEAIQTSFQILDVNINKYRTFLEDDKTCLTCIENDIQLLVQGRRRIFRFVVISVFIVYSLIWRKIEGDWNILTENIYFSVGLLTIAGLTLYAYHCMDRHRNEMENNLFKAKAKLEQAEKNLQAKIQSSVMPALQPVSNNIQLQTMFVPQPAIMAVPQGYPGTVSPQAITSGSVSHRRRRPSQM